VRGSASNPARLVAVNFVTGALTNKPAFKNMPNVKARHVAPPGDDTVKANWSDSAREAAAEARRAGTANANDASEIANGISDAIDNRKHSNHAAAAEAHKSASELHRAEADKHESSSNWKAAGEHFGKARYHEMRSSEHQSESDRMSKTKATDATASDNILTTLRIEDGQVVKAAWSDAARAAALEARKHGSYAEYSDDAHEASKRALDLSRTAQGHHQDRRAHREAAEAHENAATGHRYAAMETDHPEVVKHHQTHADFHDSMADAHRKLHDQLRQPVNGKEFATPTSMASEVTAAQDLITAALECVMDTVKATWSDAARKAAAEARRMHTVVVMEPDDTRGRIHYVEAGTHEEAARKAHDISTDHGYGFKTGTEIRVSEGKYHVPGLQEKKTVYHVKKHPGGATSIHEKESMAASNQTELDHIIARHNAENEVAVAIAIRTPEVKAALEAEAARIDAASRPDEMMTAILARQAETRAFEERLLASNPVAANHDALAAIAERNSQTVTAAGTSEGAKSGWLLRRKSDGWFIAPGGKHTSAPSSAMEIEHHEKESFHKAWGKSHYDLIHKNDAKEVE